MAWDSGVAQQSRWPRNIIDSSVMGAVGPICYRARERTRVIRLIVHRPWGTTSYRVFGIADL